jgi:hypothetical protein
LVWKYTIWQPWWASCQSSFLLMAALKAYLCHAKNLFINLLHLWPKNIDVCIFLTNLQQNDWIAFTDHKINQWIWLIHLSTYYPSQKTSDSQNMNLRHIIFLQLRNKLQVPVRVLT